MGRKSSTIINKTAFVDIHKWWICKTGSQWVAWEPYRPATIYTIDIKHKFRIFPTFLEALDHVLKELNKEYKSANG